MLNHLKKLTNFRNLAIYFIVHAVILVAVIFSVIRLMLPHVKSNLPQIEKMASESFGVDIRVSNMETGWRGLGPVLRFEDVTMLNSQTHEPLAQVHFFDVELDLFGSLRHWKLVPGRLTLDGVTLVFEQQKNGMFRLKNHLISDERPPMETLSHLLSEFQRLDIKNGAIELTMQEGNPVHLRLDHMSFFPRAEMYRFEADLTGTQIPAHIKVIADIKGKLDAIEQSRIDGYIHLSHVAYDSRFMTHKFYTIKPQSGNLDLDAWFQWENGRWHELVGKVALHQVMLQNIKNPEIILPFNFEADIAWQQLGGEFWRLSGDNITLRLGSVGSPTATFMLEGGSFEPWNFRLNAIAVDDVIDMLMISDQIDSKDRQAMHQLNAQGQLHDIQWIATPTPEGFKDWHVGIKLDNLHWQAYDKIPATSQISGEIKLSEHQGQFTLDSDDVEIVLPTLFETPLHLDQVTGVLAWVNDGVWNIHSDELTLTASDVDLKARLGLIIPKDQSAPLIDLEVDSGEFNHTIAKKYLPTKLLSPALVKWINESVENGRVTSMKTLVKGPLNHFPYKKGEGEFDMRFMLDEVDLHYHHAWPTLHHLTGELVLEGNGLQAVIDNGSVYGSAITRSTVNLPYTKATDPLILHLSAGFKGTTEDAENFLHASPLWSKLGSTFEMVEIRGPLQLDIKADIPLRGSPDNLKVNGTANLSDANVSIPRWKVALKNASGDVQFTQNSVKSSGIQGTFLEQPGVLTANTVTKGNVNEITWNFHSVLSKSLIEQFAKNNYWYYFDGVSEYDASFKVTVPKRDEPFALTLSSSLKGMSLNLPQPLQKTAEQSMPSSVTLSFPTAESLLTEFHLGDYVMGLMNFTKNKSGYTLARGQIIAGSEKSQLPLPESGIAVTGHAKHLIAQDWTEFFANHSKRFPPQHNEKNPEISIVELRVDDFQYKDWHLNHARMNVNRGSEYWNIDLNSDQIDGLIRFPHHPESSPMTFDLTRCAWPLGPSGTSMSKLTPKDVYAMEFKCKQFKYKNVDIGRFNLGVRPDRVADSVTFDPILIESSDDKVTAKGEWSRKNGVLVSQFKGEMESQNVGASLRSWAIPTDVQDAKGGVQFDLNWPGSPSDFAMKDLSGELDIRMQNGRFVGVNPGFGRMLGLLSFQGLQRRLRLDFSDVFKSGFAFDAFKSNIHINEGVAETKNGALKAPAADITFSGKSVLSTKALDFDMIVQAHIDSTIPAAAVAIANPAAGAAVWIVDKMFNPLSSVSRYRYHITGTWDKPEFTDQTEEYRRELEGPAKVKEAQ